MALPTHVVVWCNVKQTTTVDTLATTHVVQYQSHVVQYQSHVVQYQSHVLQYQSHVVQYQIQCIARYYCWSHCLQYT